MFRLDSYSAPIREILASSESGGRLMPLAPEHAASSAGLAMLRDTKAEALFGGETVTDSCFAACVRSALFLYFSALDESHTISQGISTCTGSYLHGIMHRQEPDYWNAKYWFRRAGRHSILSDLLEAARGLAAADSGVAAERMSEELRSLSAWDSGWFVDCCEAACQSGDEGYAALAERIQLAEWQLVFDYCYQKALGRG